MNLLEMTRNCCWLNGVLAGNANQYLVRRRIVEQLVRRWYLISGIIIHILSSLRLCLLDYGEMFVMNCVLQNGTVGNRRMECHGVVVLPERHRRFWSNQINASAAADAAAPGLVLSFPSCGVVFSDDLVSSVDDTSYLHDLNPTLNPGPRWNGARMAGFVYNGLDCPTLWLSCCKTHHTKTFFA